MKNVERTHLNDHTPSNGSVDLYIVPGPGSASTEFCAVVMRALRCRSCSLMLFDPNGELIVNDAAGQMPGRAHQHHRLRPEFVGAPGARSAREVGRNDRRARPRTAVGVDSTPLSLSLSLALPDGITGTLTVADREDGGAFGAADQELLEHLTDFYASTFASPARREALRLRGDLRVLRKRAIHAEESERQRLARELHDDVGHALTTAILSIDMTSRRLPADGVAVEALTAARDSLSDCADRLNEFAFHLRPRVLNDLGLAPALRGLARRAGESCALDVSVVVHGRERRLSDEAELAAFRVAQEALTNALKHAHASRITITVSFTESCLDIEISDDGTGVDPTPITIGRRHQGQGLHGMRERAELAGGALDIRSVKHVGTTVCARLPV